MPTAFRSLSRLAMALMLALCAGASSAVPQAPKDPYGQPGRLVRLSGGRALNLVCTGRGTPTVVLESGFGAGAFAWSMVQPVLARQTRVCSYDRAGYGFSDAGPLPRDATSIARDLDLGLTKAGERGPFVVVGHSAGGLYARVFAARRHAQVVGLVLVDTSIPFQDRRLAALFGPGAGNLQGVRRRPATCLQAAEARAMATLEAETCLPKEGAYARSAAMRPDVWRNQLSELDTLFSSTSEQVARASTILKDVPTIVLTASPTGLPAGPDDPVAAAWQSLHREIALGAQQGEQRIVKSGHLIMVQRPEVVTAAVSELIAKSRKRR